MRIGIGRIAQETNTFTPMLTDMAALQAHGIYRGQEVLRDLTEWSTLPGFLEVVGEEELVGITSAHATPAGLMPEDAMDTLLSWFTEDLQRALPLDGLLLAMHGAFAGSADPDVEGLFLQRARAIVGDRVPIGVSMDLHANITGRKIEHADILRGYHTHPHVDGCETSRRVAELLVATLRGEVKPVISAVKIPMITPAETQLSEHYPLKDLMDLTRTQEKDARVLSSSLFAVQPWLDVPEMGWCSVVVTDGDRELADRLAKDLAQAAWECREAFIQPCPTYLDALEDAFSSEEKPVVIADFADLMTGGGTGDSTWFLKALLARNPTEPCYVTVVDPEALKEIAAAGVGARLTLKVGGKQDKVYSSPVEVTGEVIRLVPPSPEREVPPSTGLIALFQAGQVSIVLLERLGPGSDPRLYSAVGLDPTKAKIMIAKSVVDFRQGYKGVAKRFLPGEAPGLAPSNLNSLQWSLVPRPLFPLDHDMVWHSDQAPVYRSHSRGG